MENKKLSLENIQVNNITQRKLAILGGTGSGKTSTLKMLAAVAPCPVYVFDPLNVIRIKEFDRIIFDKKTKDNGAAAGQLFNRKLKNNVIFAMKDMLQEEQAKFINDFFSTWKPHDCIIGIDEVHEFVPESGSSASYAPEVERAIKHWRNENVGFLMTSQRPAFVKKNVLALTDFLILYRTTWTHDIKAIEELLSNLLSKEETANVIGNLQKEPFLNGYTIDFRANEVT